MVSISAALLAMLLVASCATAAVARTYNVGDGFWDIWIDYSAWTVGKRFAVGDVREVATARVVRHARSHFTHHVGSVKLVVRA